MSVIVRNPYRWFSTYEGHYGGGNMYWICFEQTVVMGGLRGQVVKGADISLQCLII